MLTLGCGTYRLDGTPRMRERPIEDLLVALRQLGGDVVSELGTGCPPVVVRADGLRGGRAVVAGDISSQFLSGLLMAAPYAERRRGTRGRGHLGLAALHRHDAGGDGVVWRPTWRSRSRRDSQLPPRSTIGPDAYAIEPDASAASYFFAAAAITQGEVTVEGLSRGSLQGDVAFLRLP